MEAISHRYIEPEGPLTTHGEIAAFIQAGLEQGATSNFMNNFAFNLPGGTYRDMICTDEILQRPVQPGLRIDDVEPTYQQFFAEINAAIEAHPEIDIAQIRELQERQRNGESIQQELNRFVLPIFCDLLARGYPCSVLSR